MNTSIKAEPAISTHAHFEGSAYEIRYIGSLAPFDPTDDAGWLSIDLDLPSGLTGGLAVEFWDRIGEWTVDLNVSESETLDIDLLVTTLRYAQRLRDYMSSLDAAPFSERIRDEFAAEVGEATA